MTRVAAADAARRSLIFRIGGDRFEMDATRVVEVIRPPLITRVPHAPAALLGIANLRGLALPIISFATLLDLPDASSRDGRKIVVYDRGELIGLIVDDVIRFGDAIGSERKVDPDAGGRLEHLFRITRAGTTQARRGHLPASFQRSVTGEATAALLSVRVGSQQFGLPLENVHEVLAASAERSSIAGGDSTLLGLISFRDGVLPIVALSALLGLQAAGSAGERVVVIDYRGSTIGLAVDRVNAIRRILESAIDPVPAILRHGSGPAEIDAIARADDGKTLISILSVERLFGHSVVEQAVRGGIGASVVAKADHAAVGGEKILIFTLGEESYGLPIAAVDEVIRVPDTVTRLPNAPPFVIGAINLRGKAVPLIDQRQRFSVPGTTTTKARAIVITADQMKAGFIVDAVSEVMTVPAASLSPAPEFSSEQTTVFDRVAHLEAEDRMILLVDPRQLLSRAERDVIASLTAAKAPAMSS